MYAASRTGLVNGSTMHSVRQVCGSPPMPMQPNTQAQPGSAPQAVAWSQQLPLAQLVQASSLGSGMHASMVPVEPPPVLPGSVSGPLVVTGSVVDKVLSPLVDALSLALEVLTGSPVVVGTSVVLEAEALVVLAPSVAPLLEAGAAGVAGVAAGAEAEQGGEGGG